MRRGAAGFSQKIAIFDQNRVGWTFLGNQSIAELLRTAGGALHPDGSHAEATPVQPFPLQTALTVVR